jgi:alpha-L-fucosidase
VGGDYEDYRTPEQEVPEQPLPYVWETCMTLGDQWSYRPHDRYKSTDRLVHLLVDVVAKGGNFGNLKSQIKKLCTKQAQSFC